MNYIAVKFGSLPYILDPLVGSYLAVGIRWVNSFGSRTLSNKVMTLTLEN